MKIQSSELSMSAVSVKAQFYSKTESLELTMPNSEADTALNLDESAVILDLSNYTASLKDADKVSGENPKFKLSDQDKLKLTLIQKLFELFTGKKIKFVIPDLGGEKSTGTELNLPVRGENAPQAQGFGAVYTNSETYYEAESMSFTAKGIVRTSDGKSISIDMSLNMSREFYAYSSTQLRIGAAAVDPLVINFDAPSASLTDTKFSFDLDMDGKPEDISFVGKGSGFLALDINNDGIINDGSELFGTVSGNGFADLAKYDSDGNGWIDENDSIFDKLRIWTRDSEGNSTLLALGKKGIGAIFLGNVSSDFSLNDAANKNNGEIKKTGIYLKENGQAGTIQHVDIAI